jgi:hypothetical protein
MESLVAAGLKGHGEKVRSCSSPRTENSRLSSELTSKVTEWREWLAINIPRSVEHVSVEMAAPANFWDFLEEREEYTAIAHTFDHRSVSRVTDNLGCPPIRCRMAVALTERAQGF